MFYTTVLDSAESFKVGMEVEIKQVYNEKDAEALEVSCFFNNSKSFVANSCNTVVSGTHSAGYLTAIMEINGIASVKGIVKMRTDRVAIVAVDVDDYIDTLEDKKEPRA